MSIKRKIFLFSLSLVMIACNVPLFSLLLNNQDNAEPAQEVPTNTTTSTQTAGNFGGKAEQSAAKAEATATYTPTATQTPTATATEVPKAVGPIDYPSGVNPLTGQKAQDPASLKLAPAMLSITNWPLAARPQAGLSYTPIVFELYIGEGMSRFLAVFYGDLPNIDDLDGNSDQAKDDAGKTLNTKVGPLRSGRLPYQSLRQFYNGFLVMASAFSGVMQNLSEYSNIFGSDADDINSAMVDVTKLEKFAMNSGINLGENGLQGMMFDPQVPAGGVNGSDLWYVYNAIDMVNWKYDSASGSYQRFQDNADGQTFIQASDRLNGEALTYENVVVLFATHRMCNEYAFEIDLQSMRRAPALLFRDGKMYKIYWTTWNEEYERTTGKLRPIRFMDKNGDPFPFKPGQTWIHLTPLHTPYWESIDSNILFDLLNKKEDGSGIWVTRFYTEQMIFDQAVCDKLK